MPTDWICDEFARQLGALETPKPSLKSSRFYLIYPGIVDRHRWLWFICKPPSKDGLGLMIRTYSLIHRPYSPSRMVTHILLSFEYSVTVDAKSLDFEGLNPLIYKLETGDWDTCVNFHSQLLDLSC